ncbi:hypothetical protein [Maridesulfovibrio bastinii]|uniref:hypothetical protein n=1 Tax=Maridesulfovibrio bastinii TaxID=47157 RepID=UPI00054DDAFC|nr:hypothetical protein [Maridesulfovibrio bastinii]
MSFKISMLFLLLFFLLSVGADAKPLHSEAWYQARWCESRGTTEFVLPDETRVDCLTATHAIEFDFGEKWAESIGQSLYYAAMTGKRAGVGLIIEDYRELRFWLRLQTVIKKYKLPIDSWIVRP